MVTTGDQSSGRRGYGSSKTQDPLDIGMDATVEDILANYQVVLAETGKQQEDFFSTLSDLRLPFQEIHWLDNTITQLQDEIWRHEQDKLLLDDQVKQQTHASVSLKEEIQRLEEQNLEDRVRIQRLLALGQPSGEDVTIIMPPAAAAPVMGGFRLPRRGAGGGEEEGGGGAAAEAPAAAAHSGAGRRTRQIQGAAAAGGAAANAVGEEDLEEVEDTTKGQAGGTEATYKRKQSEWIARALRSEKDPRVCMALETLQSLNHAIAQSKASYEHDVLKLQQRRALRDAGAAEVLSPLLQEGEDTVRKMEEQERCMSEDVQSCLMMVVESLGEKAIILNEHHRLARLQKVVAARVRNFRTRVAQKGAMALEEEKARAGKEVEVEGERLKEELAGIEEEIKDLNEHFARERPRMEQKLRVLQAALERRKEGLSREKRRYRLDKEGWENEARLLAASVMKATKLEEKLKVVKRAAAKEAIRERAEVEEEEEDEEKEMRGAEESEGRVEGGEEDEEEDDENLEELADLMFQLELLMSKEGHLEEEEEGLE